MQLSQKQKTFSGFFFAFLKSLLNFKHFQKDDDPYSWCIFEIKASEKRGYIIVEKIVFRRTLRQKTWQMGWNTVAIWTTAPLPYLSTTVKVIALEKVSFSDIKNQKSVC